MSPSRLTLRPDSVDRNQPTSRPRHAPKSAILLAWIRLFIPRGSRSTLFWVIHVVLWTNVVFYEVIIPVKNFSCRPRAMIWDLTVSGTCINTKLLDIASAVVTLISDLVLLLVPQKVIWGLHLSNKKKIGVSIVFSLPGKVRPKLAT